MQINLSRNYEGNLLFSLNKRTASFLKTDHFLDEVMTENRVPLFLVTYNSNSKLKLKNPFFQKVFNEVSKNINTEGCLNSAGYDFQMDKQSPKHELNYR